MNTSHQIPSLLDSPVRVQLPSLCALFFLVVGALWGAIVLAVPMVNILSSRHWVETPCQIVSSAVEVKPWWGNPKQVSHYSLKMAYTYEVDGRSYRSERYDFLGGSSVNREWRYAVVKQLPPGSRAVCYVDPQDPTRAVMTRAIPSAEFWEQAGAAVFFFAAGLILLAIAVWELRHQRKFSGATFEWDGEDVPIGGVVKGVIRLPDSMPPTGELHLRGILRMKAKGSRPLGNVPVWPELSTVSLTSREVSVKFLLPVEVPWKLRPPQQFCLQVLASAKTTMGNFKTQFVVPVAHRELSAAESAEAEKMRAIENAEFARFQWPTNSPIRIDELPGDAKRIVLPSASLSQRWISTFVLIYGSIPLGLVFYPLLLHYQMPTAYTVTSEVMAIGVLWMAVRIWLGSTYVTVTKQGIVVSNHGLFFNIRRNTPAANICAIKAVAAGIQANRGAHYRIAIERKVGRKVTVYGHMGSRHEAQWLAQEMAHCAGMGR